MLKFQHFCHRHKKLIRAAIVLTVVGEAIIFVHAGWLEGRYADAYLIGAGWIKDTIRELIAVTEELSA